MHPYKMEVVQELKPRDYEARQIVSENMLAALPRDAIVFFSGEAHFHLSQSNLANKQNMRYWSETNCMVYNFEKWDNWILCFRGK